MHIYKYIVYLGVDTDYVVVYIIVTLYKIAHVNFYNKVFSRPNMMVYEYTYINTCTMSEEPNSYIGSTDGAIIV